MEEFIFNLQRFDYEEGSLISGTDSDDTIENYYADYVTINAGAGNDIIKNQASDNVLINGNAGNDYIVNTFEECTYDDLCDADPRFGQVYYRGSYYSTINGGRGNDTIINDDDCYGAVISGNEGNDLITNHGANFLFKYSAGDGNDTISGFNETSTLSISAGSYATQTRGYDFIVKVDKGTITLEDFHLNNSHLCINDEEIDNPVQVVSLASNNVLFSRDSFSVVGTTKDDTIKNLGNSATIDAGAGNDYIVNQGGEKVSISGSSGNDTIYNDSVYYIEEDIENYKTPDNVTIESGFGNDYISNDGEKVLFKYNAGDGNDTILGFNETSTLSISGGSYSTQISGTDIIVKVDKGTITLEDFYLNNNHLCINDELIDFWTKVGTNSDDIIENLGNSVITINAGAGDDYIENTAGNDLLINGDAGNDTILNQTQIEEHDGCMIEYDVYSPDCATINGGSGNDYIVNQSGEKVSINGGSGNDTIYNNSVYYGLDNENYKTPDNVTIEGGFGNDYISNDGEKVLFKYNAGDGNDTILGFNETSTLSISNGSYSSTKSGNNIIVTVGNGKISLISAASLSKVNIKGTYVPIALTVTDKTKSPVTVGSAIKTINASSRTKAVKVTGNAFANTITGGSGNDSIYGGKGNDSLIGNAGNDLISGGSGNDTLYGKKGNDKLYGNDGADKISGGDGNDTLWAGKGNDTLWGNSGKDLFVYTAGNDVIADFATGDKISLNASISNASAKGADATFKIGSNTLTVKNGKGKKIAFVNSKGKERTIIGGAFLATNSTSKNNTLAAWREVGDASERTVAIKIVGNAKNNTILGGSANDSLYGGTGNDSLNGGYGADFISGGSGNDIIYGKNGNDKLYGNDGADKISGGSGNDSLWGGKGNDSLWGNAGKDTFIYASGDGKDVIYGFDNTDMLKITGSFSTSYSKSKGEIYFKVGSTANAITLKDYSATSFNVNGLSYKISGSKIVKR